jgi:hypothetical protein
LIIAYTFEFIWHSVTIVIDDSHQVSLSLNGTLSLKILAFPWLPVQNPPIAVAF